MKWRAGDWVEVRSVAEIAATLDTHGALDGLPFMPEMLRFCGRRFRLMRSVPKICVELDGGRYEIREFIRDDVVLLEGARCCGEEHDGCQRECLLFWRRDWLRRLDPSDVSPSVTGDPPATGPLGPRLRTTRAPGVYYCQSTELHRITRQQTRWGIVRKCVADVRSGSRSWIEMLRLVLAPIRRRLLRKLCWRPFVGTKKATPALSMGLQAGEWVELRSADEIRETLDVRGRNRGLLVDYNAVLKYSGEAHRIRTRIEKMISESNARMCTLRNTVILEGVSCTCHSVVGGCPRQDPVFWREIWLQRAVKPGDENNTGRKVGASQT